MTFNICMDATMANKVSACFSLHFSICYRVNIHEINSKQTFNNFVCFLLCNILMPNIVLNITISPSNNIQRLWFMRKLTNQRCCDTFIKHWLSKSFRYFSTWELFENLPRKLFKKCFQNSQESNMNRIWSY